MKDKSKLYDFSTFLILILITLFFTVFGKGFLKPGNISNIINQASFLAIIGVAQLVVILTGGINLSSGSIMALSLSLIHISAGRRIFWNVSESLWRFPCPL